MKTPLDSFLTRVAAIVRRRELAAAGLWALVCGAVALILGAAVVGETLRGDHGAPLTVATAALATGLLLVRALRRARRMAGSRHRAAHTIAQNRRPLTHRSAASSPLSQAVLATDLALRQEILGAVELDLHPGNRPRTATLGSLELASAYVQAVAGRVRDCEPELAAPPPRLRAPALTLASVSLAAALLSGNSAFVRGLALIASAEDGRPPIPPEPLWSTMKVTLLAPAHAARAERILVNPSGELRVLAGTRIHLELTPRRAFTRLHVVLAHDPEEALVAPPAERADLQLEPTGTWTGSFVVRGGGSWRLVADDDDDAPRSRSSSNPTRRRRSSSPRCRASRASRASATASSCASRPATTSAWRRRASCSRAPTSRRSASTPGLRPRARAPGSTATPGTSRASRSASAASSPTGSRSATTIPASASTPSPTPPASPRARLACA
jgi:hypothetical protein